MSLLCQTLAHVSRKKLHRLHGTKNRLKCLSRRYMTNSTIHGHLKILPSVTTALAKNQPVVALESTIITHGMPYPENLRMAQLVEGIVQDHGSIPATVGLLDGKLHVGLSEEQLSTMASTNVAVKASRRDLGWVLSKGLVGGTTVSATMLAAHKADIPVFVTGGIGGVHRGGENSLDISADLTELGRTPVAVVSAGVKSILDIPKTLEFLETQGVTVATYGTNKEFPAFFTPHSGVQSPINVVDAREAAELIDSCFSLGLQSGVLIAVPIPESFAAEGQLIEGAIQQALKEAENQQIIGNKVTPFILRRVNELTKGKSLEANMALIKNNAMVGSQIARELAHIRNHRSQGSSNHGNRRSLGNDLHQVEVHDPVVRRGASDGNAPVVIGASIVDLLATSYQFDIEHTGRTYPGSLQMAYGGVGRNIADCLSRLGSRPIFVSAVGEDEHAQSLLSYCSHMNKSAINTLPDSNTGTYCAILDKEGQVLFGIGDMDINAEISPSMVSEWESSIVSAPLVCMDGNIPTETIEYICRICAQNNTPVWYEPTCQQKATKPFQSDAWKALTYASPNLNELRMMYAALEGEETVNRNDDTSLTDQIRECIQLSRKILQHVYCLVITLGENGALICRNAEPEEKFIVDGTNREEDFSSGMMSAVHYPASTRSDDEHIVSVSGAGDCLSAAFIHSILQGYDSDTCIKAGIMAANMSLASHQPVPPCFTPSTITPTAVQRWAPWQPSRLL